LDRKEKEVADKECIASDDGGLKLDIPSYFDAPP